MRKTPQSDMTKLRVRNSPILAKNVFENPKTNTFQILLMSNRSLTQTIIGLVQNPVANFSRESTSKSLCEYVIR